MVFPYVSFVNSGTSCCLPFVTAQILLDNVNCRSADRFEDCIHNGWGVHDCSSYESIGLICNPGPEAGRKYFKTHVRWGGGSRIKES